MSALEIKNVSKTFKDTKALDNVSVRIEENKIYGLLGRNGAGKTTLLNIINNRLYPDQGSVTLDGQDVSENDQILKQFYLIGEKNLFPDTIKVKDAFKWSGEFFPNFDMEYALKLSELFELPLKKKVTALSTGYQSIFRNITALSVNTPFIFLDEPVLGLDANHRELFYKTLIQKYSEDPFTCVISTHLIDEVATVLEDIIIIKKGKILCQDSCENLLKQGYSISGPASQVDSYIEGRNTIGQDVLGGLKTAYILGTPDSEELNGLEITPLDLQKLFIQLTNV
ncbi:ABC transporter ATP-binding protein [Lachnospiraceae bacterium KGMB03038]|nr:ABC transporter ATP-binding protein [Lachnospiraceae bacterium KGMB03038]